MRRTTLIACAFVLVFIAVTGSFGQGNATQSRAAKLPAFEVASIRPLDPRAPLDHSVQPQSFPSNRFTLRITNVEILIKMAFGVVDGEISGGPDWINSFSQLYSIDAKVEGDALLTQEQMRPLLQNLLEERFHLKVHREQKMVAGYALVLAKGGSKLQPSKGGPSIFAASSFELKLKNDSVEDFAKMIWKNWTTKQPIVDRTGLGGMYDFDLKFVPQDGSLRDDPRYSNLPDIFTAVQEQLGLKLVPQEVQIDYLVIDHIERPSAN